MRKLCSRICSLRDTDISRLVGRRMRSFRSFLRKPSADWFSELCFCILTANSTADMGMKVQKALGRGFLTLPEARLKRRLRSLGYRFPNKRAEYIVAARPLAKTLKRTILSFPSAEDAREWLVENVKGLGYKEASHFLRNVGIADLAILDRHILRQMSSHGLVAGVPQSITPSYYLNAERQFRKLSGRCGMPPGEADLYVWYLQTGRVLK